jgi:arylsulfatase A-like enzyme
MRLKTLHVISPLFVLLIAFASYLILSNTSNAPSQDLSKKYNVVMIVSDALRQDVLGCYGGEARTPHINWLAENGILFENSYSTSPWTSPSVVSMFTGNYATTYENSTTGKHRVVTSEPKIEYAEFPRIYVPPNEFMFVEALKLLGYVTGMEIENINASMHDNLQGFSYIPQTSASRKMADRINEITEGGLYDSLENSAGYWHSFYTLRHLLKMLPEESFFMLHWILDPHSPYNPAEKFASRIKIDEQKLPHPKNHYLKIEYNRPDCTDVEQEFIKKLYIAEVESVDERVGFVLRLLKHRKLMDSTFIIFTSDHGEQFGEHGLFEHGGHGIGCHFYEGLIRVPLIILGPRLPAGKRIKDNVSLLGLMPTLKDLLGIEYEDDVQGESFIPLFFDNAVESNCLYFDDIQEHDHLDALIENKYKLISLRNGDFELFDIVGDPQETVNLASRFPQLVEAMYEKIVKQREKNKYRRKKNLKALEGNMDQMSHEEKQKVLEKLRSLGYIK